jgi:RHS repeat-associated protein
MAVISDRGELQSAQDFFPFGMAMPGRSTDAKHRYGFNGKETDPETGLNDFGARLYDPRLGRWLAVDPSSNKYPNLSPYVFSFNSPQLFKDPDGKDAVVTIIRNEGGGGTITITATVYLTGIKANEALATAMNTDATRVYKSGTYMEPGTATTIGGKWDINIQVSYIYKEKIEPENLKAGENILNLPDQDIRSHTDAVVLEHPNGNTYHVTKTTGTVGTSSGLPEQAIKKTRSIILHETLHLLGLSDRYTDQKVPDVIGIDKNGKDIVLATKTASVPDEGFKGDIMADSRSENISPFHYKMWGQFFSNAKSYPSKVGVARTAPLKVMVDMDPVTFEKRTPTKETSKKETPKKE